MRLKQKVSAVSNRKVFDIVKVIMKVSSYFEYAYKIPVFFLNLRSSVMVLSYEDLNTLNI